MAQTRKKWKPAPSHGQRSGAGAAVFSAPGWQVPLPMAVLWMLTLAAYANSFQAGLVYDNVPILLKDPRVHAVTGENLRLILTNEYWYPPTGNGLYRPLTTLSYLFNYAGLGNGGDPAGYHVVNYLIHSANASLVFLLGLLLFGDRVTAFAAGALWAVHPVLTESVTNVIGRADLLAGFGVLAGLLCFARSCRANGLARRGWLIGAAVAAGIGIFSKESGIVVLGAVALFDFAFQRGIPWRIRAAGYAAVALPCLAYLGARHSALASSPAMRIPFTDNPAAGAGFLAAHLTAIKVLGQELALLAWPARLSCDYSYNAIPLSTGPGGGVLAAAAALLAAAGIAWWCYRHRHSHPNGMAVSFLIASGFAAMLPTSNLLFPIGALMAERLLYLPAVAFAGCLAAAVLAGARRLPALPPAAPRAALALIALLYAGRTFARNFDWKDERTLWTSAEAVVPASYRPHTSLAEGDLETALRETDRALAILDPLPDEWNTPIPYINAGKVYSDKGDTLPTPDNARWYRRSVDTLLRAQRIQAALDAPRRLAHPTTWSVLDEQLGRDYLRLAQYDQAAAAFERALQTRFAPELLSELASAYQAKGDTRRAAIALFEGLEWQPRNTQFLSGLVALYTRQMPNSCAVISAGASYRLDRNCPLVREHTCAASRELVGSLETAGQRSAADRIRARADRSGCQ